MTLCPPGLSFFRRLSPHPPPHLRLSGHLPLPIHLPQSPHLGLTGAGRPLDPSRVRAPSLPQVSVCSPRAARVSGGLWGRRSPLRLGLQQSPSPQEACLENIPAQEGLRPALGAGTMTAQRIRRYTPGGPSPQTRARTHTVPHTPSPAGSARTGAEPTRDPRARKQHPGGGPRTHSPCRPQTRKHAPRARRSPPGAAPAPSAPAVSPGRAPGPARRLSLRASPLLGPGAAAAGWARPAAAPRCLVTGTPGAGGGGECEPPHSAPCPDAPPRWARPQKPRPTLDPAPCGEA